MKKKNSLILDNEFILFCQINNIIDIDKIAKETFNRGFSLLKYGETPSGSTNERIVEVIKEVIVEKIVEVIKEVPIKIKGVTKEIIKEIPVEKIIEVIKEVKDEKEISELRNENIKLKEELQNITNSLNTLNRSKYMKNSNLGDIYSE